LLGVSISGGAIVAIRARLAACLYEPMEEALRDARLQPVVYMDEIGAPTGNADGGNPDGRRGWLWVLMTPKLTVFSQGLSRSSAAAMELLGPSFGGIVVSDRFSAYNQLPLEQRQLCWAHIVRDLTAIAERPGASAEMGKRLLNLRQQLFEHWHRWKAGEINRKQLRQRFRPIRADGELLRPPPNRQAVLNLESVQQRPSGLGWLGRRPWPPLGNLTRPPDGCRRAPSRGAASRTREAGGGDPRSRRQCPSPWPAHR
jgi:hypothetical protein